MRPLRDTSGQTVGILCVQRQMDVLASARRKYTGTVSVALVVYAVLVLVGQGLYLHRMLLHPMSLMADEASRFAVENVPSETRLADTIRSKTEIGTLAQSIDRMEEQVCKHVENLTRATAERERISTELKLATRIQADMLPNIFPAFPERDEFDIHATTLPAREVGGDFYDYFLVDEDHLCVFIADVSGKGIPATLFMMASMILLANLAQVGKSPREIMESANDTICANNREDMFVTVWLGILEISTGKLRCANAGHEYPMVAAAGGPYERMKDPHGFVLGGIAGIPYKEYELELEPGARVFVNTDGIVEATNAEEEQFGVERLLAVLNDESDGNAEDMTKRVLSGVSDFVGDAEQFDDLTMVSLQYVKRG